MARAEIDQVVIGAVTGGYTRFVPSASVQVNVRGGGAATVYVAEVGVTTKPNPIITDASGRIEGWLDTGSYDLVISGDSIATYTQPFEAVSGSGGAGSAPDATSSVKGLVKLTNHLGGTADLPTVPGLATESAARAAADALLAPLASPALTGNPTAPTQAGGDNSTRIASTAYVQGENAAFVPKSLVDAKGDIFVGTADNVVARLGVGSNGQVLTADSSLAAGIKWAAAAGGGSTDVFTVYNAKATYGATGNGTTDDTAAIQAAIDAATAAGGGIVFLPPGTYRVATTINMKSNVQLYGSGIGVTIILLDDVAAVGIGLNNGASTTASTSLSANLTEWSNSATVVSSAGFSIGDLVEFTSANDRYGFWMTRITNIVGNVITLEEPSPTVLLTSDTAVMRKWAMATNVRMQDFELRNATAAPTLRTQPIWMTRFNRLHLERIFVNRSARDIALFEHGLDLTLHNCEGRDCFADGTTLGWAVQSTTNAKLNGLRTHNCGLGPTLYGCPRSVISDCQVNNSYSLGSRGLKVEAGSNYSTVTNCSVSNVDVNHDGYHISDCWAITLDNITADNCGESCSITETISGRTHDITISNFGFRKTTESAGGYGIRVSSVLVTNVLDLVIGPGTISDTVGPGISIAGGTDWSITGVLIKNTTKSGISITPGSSVDMWGKVTGCVMHNIGTSGSDGGFFAQNANRINVSDLVIHNYFSTASAIQLSATGNPTNNSFTDCIIDNGGSGGPYTNSGTGSNILDNLNWTGEFPNFGANDYVRMPPRQLALTDGAAVNLRASRGNYFTLAAGGSRTMNAPQDPAKGMDITVDILNNTGGAITTTWNAAYKLAGAWVDPATTKRRTIRFRYDGTNWIETGRVAADI